MRNYKLSVQSKHSDGSIHEIKYKSFKEIEKSLNLDYHIVREINRITEGKVKKKFTHPNISSLTEKIKIFDIKPIINI